MICRLCTHPTRLLAGMPPPKDRVRQRSHNHRPHVRLGRCLNLGLSIPIRQWKMSYLVGLCWNDALVVGTVSRMIWTPLFSGVVGIFFTVFSLSFLFFIHSNNCYWKGVCCFLLCCSRRMDTCILRCREGATVD